MAATTTPEVAKLMESLLETVQADRLLALGLISGAVVFALLLHWIVFRLAINAVTKSRSSLMLRVLRRIRAVARIVAVIFAIELPLPAVRLPEGWDILIDRIVTLMLIGTCGWLANQLVRSITDYRMSKYDLKAEDNLEARKVATRMKVLRQGMSMIILLVTVATMLMTFPSVRAIGVSLFASAGVAGIVIGFAARPVLSNLLAGIQIALTQPIRIDDAVIMEGEWGWIEEITATYVVVKIWDWRRLVVPLTQIIEKPFQNWTRENASIIGSVVWYLDYTAPVAAMREKLKEFLDESTLWDRDVQVLQVIDTTQETMQLRALMSAKNSPTAWDLRCEIREKMISWLQENHPGALPRRRGQIQMDQSDVEVVHLAAPASTDGSEALSSQIQHPEES